MNKRNQRIRTNYSCWDRNRKKPDKIIHFMIKIQRLFKPLLVYFSSSLSVVFKPILFNLQNYENQQQNATRHKTLY